MFDRVQREDLSIPIHRYEHRTGHERDRGSLFDRDHEGRGKLRGDFGVPDQRVLLEALLYRRQVIEHADER